MTDLPPPPVKVAIVVDYEAALLIKKFIDTAMNASHEALEMVSSIDVKTRIVEQRGIMLDIHDALDKALLGHNSPLEGT